MIEVKGRLKNIFRTIKTNKLAITLEVEGLPDSCIEELEKKDLRICMKQWREKRSLDANAYMWVLTSEIAEKTGSLPEDVHRSQVYEFNRPDLLDDNRPMVVTLRSDIDVDRYLPGYWRFYSDHEGFNSYYKIKGSSDFDSKEMAQFLELIVIPACRELGISTATPDEIRKMEALYGKKIDKCVHR